MSDGAQTSGSRVQSLDAFYGAVPTIRSHICAYKFDPICVRTARFDECGKTAILIATARRKF